MHAMWFRQEITHALFWPTSSAGYGCGVKKVILDVSPAPPAEAKSFGIEKRQIVECQILPSVPLIFD
jgi:hypothetical protein